MLTVCHHHSTTTFLHTIALRATRGTADRYGPNSSMHFFGFSISNFLQNLLSTKLRHLFNTLPYTPLTLYKQINPQQQQHTLHADRLTPLFYITTSWCLTTYVRRHTFLSWPIGVLLCSSSQRERSSLLACCGEEGQMLRA